MDLINQETFNDTFKLIVFDLNDIKFLLQTFYDFFPVCKIDRDRGYFLFKFLGKNIFSSVNINY